MQASVQVSTRLGAYYFAYFAYVGAFMPYFSLWLVAQGLGAAQVALVLAMPQVARIFAPTLWGWLADHTGRQREVVIFSAFAVAAGFASLFVLRGAGAVAIVLFLASALSAGAMPLVEATTLATLRGGAGSYGPIRLWGSIGFILAVLGTGAWLDRAGVGYALSIVLGLAVLVCAAAFGVPAGTRHEHGPVGERVLEVSWRGEVLALFAAGMCMAVAHGALYAFYSIYLEAAGYSKSVIGALWTLGVVAEVVVFLRLPQLMRRFSLRHLLIASFACAAVRFLAIGWGVEWIVLLAAAQLLHAATFGAYHAASIAAVHRLFPGRMAGRGQTLFSSLSYGFGGALGTLLAGWSWTELGPSSSFAVSALFGAGGAMLVAWKVRL
jgi:MFS transporter, PPP family, 3-phenylpropionic acid transporter